MLGSLRAEGSEPFFNMFHVKNALPYIPKSKENYFLEGYTYLG